MISRRTIVLVASCSLAIAVPTSYEKGRAFEGHRLKPESYLGKDDLLSASPVVFIRTLVGGEPEILRVIASIGLLLTGFCVISLAFDFVPRRSFLASEITETSEGRAETKIREPNPGAKEISIEEGSVTMEDEAVGAGSNDE